jgi:dCTP deaminase
LGFAMTVLENEALLAAMNREELADRLIVTPLLDPKQVGPSSIDVRLATEFRVFRRTGKAGIDPQAQTDATVDEAYDRVVVPLGEGLWLHPGQFALGATLEYLRIPRDLSGYVIGRSTWGRIGLIVATAILVHPGYTGCLTLELANEGDSPIRLYPGIQIAQLVLHSLNAPTEKPYGTDAANKYLAHTTPRVSKLDKEREEISRIANVANRLHPVPAADRSPLGVRAGLPDGL